MMAMVKKHTQQSYNNDAMADATTTPMTLTSSFLSTLVTVEQQSYKRHNGRGVLNIYKPFCILCHYTTLLFSLTQHNNGCYLAIVHPSNQGSLSRPSGDDGIWWH